MKDVGGNLIAYSPAMNCIPDVLFQSLGSWFAFFTFYFSISLLFGAFNAKQYKYVFLGDIIGFSFFFPIKKARSA